MKRVEKLFYRILISVLRDDVKYDSFVIGSDEDLKVLFHCCRQFPEVRTPELLAKLVYVVSSSGGSNRNPQGPATAACSSSRPGCASSSVPVIAPKALYVASPSFTANLHHSGDRVVGVTDTAPVSLHGRAPDGIDDILHDDDEDENVESDTIADDSGSDIARSNPVGNPGAGVGFGARDTQDAGGPGEFQVGQQFQERRGVQYKVVEYDYRKYYGKCKEFGNGCAWLIRISLRQRRGIWSVQRYNEPHTCLETSISSDHRSLDYHVISTFILPMVRADAAVCIKDGNANILPVAFALVEGENAESWSFFLSHLRQHVTPPIPTSTILRHQEVNVQCGTG
ncbi:uncharacterized protein LOC107647749 [Arachis ipaensis]|uniref:uncharacterized protein LOC107647749 n=1 Tax=Arachis ipaensis TaxID=130454 RepID=UPI0007AF5017|nr:uncharacterized protein LOC107647749 [Arachis ipaensis]